MVRSDRVYRFDAPPHGLWAAIGRTDEYRAWWPWLRSFESDGGFREGAAWACLVQPPLPWSLRFTITLDEVVAETMARATVTGDIMGTATLTIAPDGSGSTARLVSDLAPASALLRAAALAARPLVFWGHDWILDRGAGQFRQRGLSSDAD